MGKTQRMVSSPNKDFPDSNATICARASNESGPLIQLYTCFNSVETGHVEHVPNLNHFTPSIHRLLAKLDFGYSNKRFDFFSTTL